MASAECDVVALPLEAKSSRRPLARPGAAARFARWVADYRARQMLARLDSRMLRDAGFEADEITGEIRRIVRDE